MNEIKKTRPSTIMNTFITQAGTNPDNALFSLIGSGSVSGPSSVRTSNSPQPDYLKLIDKLTKKLQDIYKLIETMPPNQRRLWMISPGPYLKELFKALEKHTGIKFTQERRRAIIDFFKAGAKNKPADVHADGETDFIDVIKIYEAGKFNPVQATPLQIIENLTKRLKYMFDHNLNADNYLQKLYKALEQHTGKKITQRRIDAIKQFFKAVAMNRAADTNADEKNDFLDVLKIWKSGNFITMVWNPEENIPLPY